MMRRLRLPLLLSLGALACLFLWYVPREMVFRPTLHAAATPARVGLAFENFRVRPSDIAIDLAGWWMPAARPRAALLFIHGGGSSRNSEFFRSLEFYRALVERGVSVAAIDLRNHGDSGSDGLGLQFGRTEKADVLAALAWMRERAPGLPLYAMGISMGGAAVIHAAATGESVAGLVLLDPALDTASVLSRAAWAESGLPPELFLPSAWMAIETRGLPSGAQEAAALAANLTLPTLLLQDPDDPVALAPHARALAASNPRIRYLELPPTQADDAAKLAWKHRWGSHVAAFTLHPQQVVDSILAFIAADPPQR